MVSGTLPTKVAAWDVNCPQHIPVKIDAHDVTVAIDKHDARIAELEAELRKLRADDMRG